MTTYPISFPSASERLLTVTKPTPHVWVIELNNGPENRLTKRLLQDAFLPALDCIEYLWRVEWRAANAAGNTTGDEPGTRNASIGGAERTREKDRPVSKATTGMIADGGGAVVITGNLKQDKFFSNGLDLESALAESGFFLRTFNPWLCRLLTFPIPLVAALNGHAFAGGWLLAASCDYRVMSGGRCWASMNEVKFGSAFPVGVIRLLHSRFPTLTTIRRLVQEGHLWTAQELFAERMIDCIVEPDQNTLKEAGSMSQKVLAKAIELAEQRSGDARSGVYGLIKKSLAQPITTVEHYDSPLPDPVHENATEIYQLKTRILRRTGGAKL